MRTAEIEVKYCLSSRSDKFFVCSHIGQTVVVQKNTKSIDTIILSALDNPD